ncbi:MAG: ribosomal protein S18-alanine N-acetyltransferase [Lachnospiraceae bacterium]|nr:ribosomal protein S18-alanine N-acetyltransferase [Lachnospiraceae bacterium]
MEDTVAAAALEAENFSEPWSANSFMEEIKKDSSIYIVACDGEMLVGTCGLVASFDEGEVLNVSVKKEYRKQGIALQMLQYLLEEAKIKGIKHFTLEVREGNVPARTLYEKLGFVCEGIRPNFYRNPTENAAIYWLHQE